MPRWCVVRPAPRWTAAAVAATRMWRSRRDARRCGLTVLLWLSAALLLLLLLTLWASLRAAAQADQDERPPL